MAKRSGRSGIDPKAFLLQVFFAFVSCLGRLFVNEHASFYVHLKKISKFLLAMFMFGGAYLRCNKTIVEKLLVKIVPPPLPPYFCVYASGVCELMCGLLLLFNLFYPFSAYNKVGGTSVVLLLWAVFPKYLPCNITENTDRHKDYDSWRSLCKSNHTVLFLGWAGWHTDLPTESLLHICIEGSCGLKYILTLMLSLQYVIK